LANERRRVAGQARQQSPGFADGARSFSASVHNQRREKFYCIEISGSAVGGIGFKPGEDVHRHTAEIGYWLGEEFWGKGIMSEVVPAFVNYCFEKFSLKRISAAAYSSNPASARVLEKAGFVFEGRLRKNVVKDGQILDSLLYARTI
jgi:RimJ/RimL family protein N-acetyltransferase